MPAHEPGLERWYELIMQGQPFVGDPAKSAPAEMEILRERGMKAVIEVPVYVNGNWWGVIGFDDEVNEREWTNAEVDALKVAANVLSAAIQRQLDDIALKDELSQRKRLIEELEFKNSELERFTYTVSHDLKSPLITMRGFLRFIEQDARSGNMERMRADIQRISDATDKMQRLLNELLEISRIGRLMNVPVTTSLEDLAREAIDNVHGQLEARNVSVIIRPDLPNIHGDRQRLVEVIQNLVDNAAKFMGDQPSPQIVIGQQNEEDGKLIFFVRDNGIGIAPEHHERVFGLFNKLNVDTEGMGVGLAIVKRIIEVHGGRIWLESEPGKGTTFYFTLDQSS
jgi:signal transduction histidine kinase